MLPQRSILRINPKSEYLNPKWFDELTTLSQVEGQIQIFKILPRSPHPQGGGSVSNDQNQPIIDLLAFVLNIGEFELPICFVFGI